MDPLQLLLRAHIALQLTQIFRVYSLPHLDPLVWCVIGVGRARVWLERVEWHSLQLLERQLGEGARDGDPGRPGEDGRAAVQTARGARGAGSRSQRAGCSRDRARGSRGRPARGGTERHAPLRIACMSRATAAPLPSQGKECGCVGPSADRKRIPSLSLILPTRRRLE
eukprot:scaffold160474_cov37-Tisochrysis_lutea.AAC.3